jgi:hypothetical protein
LFSISKLNGYRRGTQIGDDVVGYSKAVHDILDEFDCFCYTILHEWLVFDPLSEFVDFNKDVLKSAFGLFEWSYLIQPSAYERPMRRDAN